MRRVTFSRNYTLSLSRTCQCYCKYCAFATHRAHIHAPEAVEAKLDEAERRNAKELLVLTGERPEVNAEVAARLAEWGHDDFTSYVVWACERALERGILPHTNLGVLEPRGSRPAAGGHRLPGPDARVDLRAADGDGPRRVARRSIRRRGSRRSKRPASCGSRSRRGILVGIGETEDERVESLEALARSHERHGHLQEVILQNFVPHPRYYGREVGGHRGSRLRATGGRRTGTPHPEPPRLLFRVRGPRPLTSRPKATARAPNWATEVTIDDIKRLIQECKRLMPDVGIQIPPNLSDWWSELVEAGATDLGGLSANGDHISPEHAFPSPHQVRKELAPRGFALTERLCVYPQYMDPEWMEQGVLDVIKLKYWSFIPRRGSGRRVEEVIDPGLAERAIAKGREGEELSEDELTALFAETRPEVIEEMRAAADELRAELAGDRVTFVVNRNINFTNICVVGCAFCGFGQGRRSPDAYEVSEEDFAERIREAVEFGATEICMQGGIHPDLTLEEYGKWLRLAKQVAPQLHLHAYSPMEVHYMCERSGKGPDEVFEYLLECGLGSTPGTAAEVLDDGVRQRISPNKLPVERWVEIIEASHRAGLRSTSTVMFGHIEEPRELARHMRVVRALQERTGGITEFVPLSFIPFNTMLGRTHGIEEIGERENLKHTAAFRLALGRTIPNLQASWVKMGLGAATEALRWGVNDLGGTLMEENISRMAGSQHGVRLEPEQLIEAARAAGRVPAQRTTLYEIVETYEAARRSSPRRTRSR